MSALAYTQDEYRRACAILEDATRDRAYRATPIGREVGRFLRAMRWSDLSDNTLDTYEVALRRLSEEFAHLDSLEELDTDRIRTFLDKHWGDLSAATRRGRLAAVHSFLTWSVGEGRLSKDPSAVIKPPRRRKIERQSHSHALLKQLIVAQPNLKDQIGLQLLGLLGLRKNELRLIRVRDVDLSRGEILVHGKGGKVVVMPIVFEGLKRDLYLHLIERHRDEYLLHPRGHRDRAMNQATLHRWFKTCCERAELPDVQMHELRHTAADMLWRITGNLIQAQLLLRHESAKTTELYLHPRREDLEAGMRAVDEVWRRL